MIEFSYKDKLKLQELLTSSGFLYLEDYDTNTLEAKPIYDKNCYIDDNDFYHKLYKVLSIVPNIADLKFVIDHQAKIVTFADVIFPEDHFVSYCKNTQHENFDGKLAFYLSSDSHLCADLYKVFEKHCNLMGKTLQGHLDADDDNSVLFVTEYDFTG